MSNHLNDLFDEVETDEQPVEVGTGGTGWVKPGATEGSGDSGESSVQEETEGDVQKEDGGVHQPEGSPPAEGTEVETEQPEGEGNTKTIDEDSQAASKEADYITEINNQRRMLREMAQRLTKYEKDQAQTKKSLEEQGLIEGQDPEKIAEAEKAQQFRAAQLETLLEAMRVNPQFADIDAVVTQQRYTDLLEGIASAVVQKHGVSMEEAYEGVQQNIWGRPNPYKFLYENIKGFHPDFASAEETPKETPKKEPSKKEPVDIPPTVAGAGGGGSGGGGWTAARIDSMEEEDLHKVPKEVYEKYLTGELK